MEICFLTNNINQGGGIERVIKVLSDYFADKYRLSILSIYSNGTHTAFEFSDDVEIIHAGVGMGEGFKIFLNDFLDSREYDILFTFHPTVALEFVTVYKNFPNLKWIATEHSSQYEYTWKRRLLNQIVYRHADRLVLLTDQARKYYNHRLLFNTTVIPNPLSFETKKKSDGSNKTIIAVGRLEKVKGFDFLIHAFAKIADFNSEWKLKIVGIGSEKENLQTIVNEYNLKKQVEFCGFQRNIEPFLLEASFLAISSQSEGFCLVATEAMECGLSILSVELPSVKEIEGDGNFVSWVEQGNIEEYAKKMQQLIDNPESLVIKGNEAKRYAQRYSIVEIGKQWEILFEDLIGTKNELFS